MMKLNRILRVLRRGLCNLTQRGILGKLMVWGLNKVVKL